MTHFENARTAWDGFIAEFETDVALRQKVRHIIRAVVMDCRNATNSAFTDLEVEMQETKLFAREWHSE